MPQRVDPRLLRHIDLMRDLGLLAVSASQHLLVCQFGHAQEILTGAGKVLTGNFTDTTTEAVDAPGSARSRARARQPKQRLAA